MSTWRAAWSMVGRWLVYVPNPEGGELQFSLPEHMEREAAILAAANDLLALAYQYRDDLRYPPESDSRARRLDAINDVISRVEKGS